MTLVRVDQLGLKQLLMHKNAVEAFMNDEQKDYFYENIYEILGNEDYSNRPTPSRPESQLLAVLTFP